MKKTFLAILAVAVTLPAHAQLFSSEGLGGALLGGIAGGIIGHNNHRQTAEGIAIGAGSGLVLGSLIGQSRRNSSYYDAQPYAYSSAPSYSYGYTPSYYSYSPSYYSPGYGRPNYAISGAALGALGGAVIGHNNHRQTAEGAGIGAAAGFVLGSIAEHNARRREVFYSRPVYITPQASSYFTPTFQTVAAPAQQQQPAAQNITIINNYYGSGTPPSGANSLFGR